MCAGIDVHVIEALGNGAGGRRLSRGRAAINGDDAESRTVWHIFKKKLKTDKPERLKGLKAENTVALQHPRARKN
ncbi:MAG: hypothetical protein ACJAU9_000445 [Lentimonas sp.]|jgi:hypothetical protein